MTGIVCTAVLAFAPGLAPVPAAPPPDPLAWGYLGIRVGEQEPLLLVSVEPNTPAERAGLQAGDTLVRIGDLRPREFAEVVEHISGFRPGTLLRVQVRRGPELKMFIVRLGVRPAELGSPRGRPPGE